MGREVGGVHEVGDFDLVPNPFEVNDVHREGDARVGHVFVLMKFGLAAW